MPEDRIQDDEKRPRRPRRDEEEEERPRRARRDEVEEERPRRARRDDEEEERPRRRRIRRDDEDEGGGMNSLIPYKNPKALIAYYVGVFALIPIIGIPLGIASIILGVLGLKYRKTHPTAGGTGHAWAGIVLGMLVLLGHLAAVVFVVMLANAK
jgi:hypothetical protein